MKRSILILGVILGLAAFSIAWAQAQKGKPVLLVSADQAKFQETPNSNGRVSMAPIWGKAETGAHATFTKFAPGYDAGFHTHTNDVSIVVIKGAYLYKDSAGEKRVGPGDFLRVPGGHKHWSGGDKSEGALFYEESPGKFDLIPSK